MYSVCVYVGYVPTVINTQYSSPLQFYQPALKYIHTYVSVSIKALILACHPRPLLQRFKKNSPLSPEPGHISDN